MADVIPDSTSRLKEMQQAVVEELPSELGGLGEFESGDRIFEDTNGVETDTASVLVIILQSETQTTETNINNLKWVFSDPYFTVQVCAVDPPLKIHTNRMMDATQYLENYYMRKALSYAGEGPYTVDSDNEIQAQRWWNKLPCIIVKDTSISNIVPSNQNFTHNKENGKGVGGGFENVKVGAGQIKSPDGASFGMKKRVKTALDRARQADLFFLCKWNDECDIYTSVSGGDASEGGSSLKWSKHPTSTQAIMYTPIARDMVRDSLLQARVPLSEYLNTNISQGKYMATVFVPNIIDFDINLATSNRDYAKLNECALPPPTTTATTATTIIWLLFVIILVVLVAWALIQLAPKPTPSPL